MRSAADAHMDTLKAIHAIEDNMRENSELYMEVTELIESAVKRGEYRAIMYPDEKWAKDWDQVIAILVQNGYKVEFTKLVPSMPVEKYLAETMDRGYDTPCKESWCHVPMPSGKDLANYSDGQLWINW